MNYKASATHKLKPSPIGSKTQNLNDPGIMSLTFSMIGRRDPLAHNKRSWMSVEMSRASLQSVKSVSKMEMEQMASSKVLGIFCALAMCNNAVARLLYKIGCHIGIRFLASRKSRASIGVWIETVSRSVC